MIAIATQTANIHEPDTLPGEETATATPEEKEREEKEREERENDLNEIRVDDDLGEPDPEDKDLAPTDAPLPEEPGDEKNNA